MRIIMLSPPGAGKGTHCTLLAEATGISHISSGDLLRQEIAADSDVGRRAKEYTSRGDLVPDEILFELLVPALVEANRDTGGFLLDGFPRTMEQALRAAEIGIQLGLTGDAAIYLSAPDDVLIARLLARAELEGRSDDTPDVIRHRLQVFEQKTRPLVEYYRSRGILHEVDADRTVDAIQADIRSRLRLDPS